MKSSVPASYRYTGWLFVFFALLIVPISGFLPDWVSFENGPIENTQVILLLGCALMCVKFARDTLSSPSHKMWLPSAGIFLILAARELSWGRVFFVKEYSAAGEPILIASSEMPFRTGIHGCIGVLAVLCLYGLIRFVPWERIFREISFPWIHLIATIACVIAVTIGDHHAIFHTLRDQQIEELSELLMYAILGHTAWYYYLHLKK